MATNSNLRSLNPILMSDLRFHAQSVPKFTLFALYFGLRILGHPVHRILNLTSKSDSATSNYYVYPFLSTYLNYNTINNVGI